MKKVYKKPEIKLNDQNICIIDIPEEEKGKGVKNLLSNM